MIKLTPRLKMISEEILKGETMADIGTDHGFLPIFLLQSKVCPFVVMTDISYNSLKKAEDNCSEVLGEDEYPEEDGIKQPYLYDLRLGSGIEVIETKEVDALVIAGMGGILMTEILGKDKKKSKSFKKIVLQPRSQIGFLRHWLYNNGFSIEKEQLVAEGNNICEILTVVPKEKAITRGMDENCVEYEFPHTLVDFKSDLTIRYLTEHLTKEKFILDRMRQANNRDSKKERHQEYRVEYIEYLIQKIVEKE